MMRALWVAEERRTRELRMAEAKSIVEEEEEEEEDTGSHIMQTQGESRYSLYGNKGGPS